MFVQVFEGRVADRDGLHRQMDRWMSELRPGATGFLGSTVGVTGDGYGIAFARFESAAAAKANSERSEQGRWWSETEKCFGARSRSRIPMTSTRSSLAGRMTLGSSRS